MASFENNSPPLNVIPELMSFHPPQSLLVYLGQKLFFTCPASTQRVLEQLPPGGSWMDRKICTYLLGFGKLRTTHVGLIAPRDNRTKSVSALLHGLFWPTTPRVYTKASSLLVLFDNCANSILATPTSSAIRLTVFFCLWM